MPVCVYAHVYVWARAASCRQGDLELSLPLWEVLVSSCRDCTPLGELSDERKVLVKVFL